MTSQALFLIKQALRALPALACLVATTSAVAAQPDGWQTWTWKGACFAVLFPEEAEIEALKTEKAYISVKHAPDETTFNSVSFVSGIADLEGAEASVDFDGRSYSLLVYNGAGFVSSGTREDKLIEELRSAAEARVTWRDQSSMITQVYRLDGFARAKATIDTACPRQ